MKRRDVLVMGGAVLAVGCTTGGTGDPAAKRREIEAAVDDSLAKLYSSAPGSRELAAKARGILVFPSVVSAGFVVGGSYGQGALRKGGTTAGYYSISQGSVGLLAGAESKSMYVLFMTDEAMSKFETGKGWTIGAEAGITLVNVGAEARVDNKTATAPVIGYVRGNTGFMANVSLDGTNINKIDL